MSKYVPEAISSRNRFARRPEWIVFHRIPVQKNIVTDEEQVFKYIKSKTRSVAVDVKGLDATMNEIFRERGVKCKRAADLVN